MTDAPKGKGPGAKSRKRWLVLALAGAVVLAGAGYFFLLGQNPQPDETETAPTVVSSHVERKPAVSKLGVEYHFDRNAIEDSRLVGNQLLGLTTAGNLLTLDAETFALRKERVLHRRATCLGPADQSYALAGISNGAIVRVSAQALSIERVGQVPGVPRWIGTRSKDGGFVTAYQTEGRADANLLVADEGSGRTYDLGPRPAVLFLDSKDRLWVASPDKVRSIDLLGASQKSYPLKSGVSGVRGFVELADGQVWAFGGTDRAGGVTSFVVRLAPEAKLSPLYAFSSKARSPGPDGPITHILEDQATGRLLVVSPDNVLVSDASLADWRSLDGMTPGGREADALLARGQAHLSKHGLLLSLVRGGVMEVTADYARRHTLDNQYPVFRPSEIVRLAKGMAFYGDGGPSYYVDGGWRSLPDPIMPPAELQGTARAGERERVWAATTTIPIEGQSSFVITKAGPPRHYIGHMHGLRDVFLTARWDGAVLSVLGREELPIEPDDTFVTPDRQLWNVDDQGLWNFNGGHWRMVMRLSSESASAHAGRGAFDSAGARADTSLRSAIGEPLHFAHTPRGPFHGLPRYSASWSLVRLDSNDAGGGPLIDEIPVRVDGRRALMRDVTVWGNSKDTLLLATDRGLCAFNMKFGNCDVRRPEGLDGEVGLFMRDGTKRLWLGGRGLWILRDDKHADAVHPSIPMLADTQVVAMAEAPDGRMVIGTADRGVIFLAIPQGWFQRPAGEQIAVEAWEGIRPHEPLFGDRSLVLQVCDGKAAEVSDATMAELVAGLREVADKAGGRARVELEEQYEGRPDVAVRGPNPEAVFEEVQPLLQKPSIRGKLSAYRRFGGPGSESVRLVSCP
jgi:hypothetical protein